MSDVQFDGDDFRPTRVNPSGNPQFNSISNDLSREPKMVRFLIEHNWVSSIKAAHTFLYAVVLIDFAVAFVIIKYFV